MTQGDNDDNVHSSTHSTLTTRETIIPPGPAERPGYRYYSTDTIAAVTIAVLAVVIIITLLLVIRALRKRRRARRGEQFGQVQTVTTGVMGSGKCIVLLIQKHYNRTFPVHTYYDVLLAISGMTVSFLKPFIIPTLI